MMLALSAHYPTFSVGGVALPDIFSRRRGSIAVPECSLPDIFSRRRARSDRSLKAAPIITVYHLNAMQIVKVFMI